MEFIRALFTIKELETKNYLKLIICKYVNKQAHINPTLVVHLILANYICAKGQPDDTNWRKDDNINIDLSTTPGMSQCVQSSQNDSKFIIICLRFIHCRCSPSPPCSLKLKHILISICNINNMQSSKQSNN